MIGRRRLASFALALALGFAWAEAGAGPDRPGIAEPLREQARERVEAARLRCATLQERLEEIRQERDRLQDERRSIQRQLAQSSLVRAIEDRNVRLHRRLLAARSLEALRRGRAGGYEHALTSTGSRLRQADLWIGTGFAPVALRERAGASAEPLEALRSVDQELRIRLEVLEDRLRSVRSELDEAALELAETERRFAAIEAALARGRASLAEEQAAPPTRSSVMLNPASDRMVARMSKS